MNKLKVCRRQVLRGMGAGAGSAMLGGLFGARPSSAAEQVVWAGWGGDYQGLQSMAFAPPFTEDTGVEVVEVASPGNMVAIIKAQIEGSNPEWDVVELVSPEIYQLASLGYLSEMNFDPDVSNDYQGHPEHLGTYHATFNITSLVLGWSSEAFPSGSQPNSWADFWDVGKFSGARTGMSWYPFANVEIALMADGVPKDEVYPLTDEKIQRAFDKWRELKSAMHVWWVSGAQSQQLFADGEVQLGGVYDGRVRELKKQGVPVDWTFNEGIVFTGNWVIPAGSKNKEAAMRFVNTTLRPDVQAEYVRISQYGASNEKAYDLLTDEEKSNVAGYGPNYGKQLLLDGEFWADAWSEYSEAWDSLISG